MKRVFNYIMILVAALVVTTSCKEYLDVPVEAAKTDAEIFGDYYNFQGFVDQLYIYVPDPIYNSVCTDNTWGGEALSTTTWCTGYNAARGLYKQFMTRGYLDCTDDYGPGIWRGWDAIRVANIGLSKLDMLNATDEEKATIEGQLRFFRAYFHQEMLAAWGPIPYIKNVLVEDFKLPRFFEYNGKSGYQAVAECVLEDMNKAAELLPEVWDEPTKNWGRCTALAAKAYEARAALFAGSPLMAQWSGKSVTDMKAAEVNTEYMERAAKAAGEFIVMVEKNSSTYGLLDWENYSDMFYTVDGITSPWSKETMWGRYIKDKGNGNILNCLGRVHLPDNVTFGGNAINNTVTQNYVDLFEMNDGSLYDPATMDGKKYTDANGVERLKMWDDRDARFRQSIYVDRDYAGFAEKTLLALYTDDNTSEHKAGKTRTSNSPLCPYFIHKYWPKGANKADNGAEYSNMRFMVPLMRIAEVYLIYAEALNECGKVDQTAGGCSLTGLQAVNVIRARAKQPATDANGGAHGSFRKMILNERAVELCFEGAYWYDLRRYKLGAAMNGEELLTLDFDKNWTSFSRRSVVNRVFEEKHYWMPFPSDMCKMYEGFQQNPGWE